MTKAIHNDNDTDKFPLHDAIDECDNILHRTRSCSVTS